MLLAVFINSIVQRIQISLGGDSDLDLGQLLFVGIGFQMGAVGIEDPAADHSAAYGLIDDFVENLLMEESAKRRRLVWLMVEASMTLSVRRIRRNQR
jgi:hypothetical protein